MKQFLLFAGYHYYPSGGWDDFSNSYDTVKEAAIAYQKTGTDWGQVVDLTSGVPVVIELDQTSACDNYPETE
jgi:hypothetical protein